MKISRISPLLHEIMANIPVGQKIPLIVELDIEKITTERRSPFIPGARPLRHFPFVAAEVTLTEIQQLVEDTTILHIWPDLPVYAFLDISVPLIRAPRVWDIGYTGDGVKVGVVDSGIDPHHPDFKGRIAETYSAIGDDGIDRFGHGTHVAGIIAGDGKASRGKYKGVAPGAVLYSAKVLKDDGSGRSSDVLSGLEWLYSRHVQVINMSLGTPGPCDGTDAVSYFCNKLVEEHGIVIVAAAGNNGPASKTIGSPGCAEKVITVGATTDMDKIPDFSSRGPTEDGRKKPDVCFPGANITSARAAGSSLGALRGDHYMELSGTSMAAPHASGLAALLLDANPNLTPKEVKEAIMSSAIDIGADVLAQGAGRGDAFEAYKVSKIEKEPLSPTPKRPKTQEPKHPHVPPDTPPSPTEPNHPGKGCLGSIFPWKKLSHGT